MTYAEKLKDPRWKRRRDEIVAMAGYKCSHSGCKETKRLHVHHSYYWRDHEPWDYPDDALHCLCEQHHEDRAVSERVLLCLLKDLSVDQLTSLAISVSLMCHHLGPKAAAATIAHTCRQVTWPEDSKEPVYTEPPVEEGPQEWPGF